MDDDTATEETQDEVLASMISQREKASGITEAKRTEITVNLHQARIMGDGEQERRCLTLLEKGGSIVEMYTKMIERRRAGLPLNDDSSSEPTPRCKTEGCRMAAEEDGYCVRC